MVKNGAKRNMAFGRITKNTRKMLTEMNGEPSWRINHGGNEKLCGMLRPPSANEPNVECKNKQRVARCHGKLQRTRASETDDVNVNMDAHKLVVMAAMPTHIEGVGFFVQGVRTITTRNIKWGSILTPSRKNVQRKSQKLKVRHK